MQFQIGESGRQQRLESLEIEGRGHEAIHTPAIASWAPRRIHTIPDAVILQQTHALREAGHVLWKGNNVAPKLREPRAADGRVVHLHMLQGHQHCLRRRSHAEQF